MRTACRILVVAAALFVATTVLPGCRSSEPVVVAPPESSSTPQPTTSTVEPQPLSKIQLDFELVAEGFDQPLYATGSGDGSGRLFVVEKTGRVWILHDGVKAENAFLDMSDAVSTDSERGLLGLAFAPDFETSGNFYIDYTNTDGNTTISRMTAEGDVANRSSEEVLLTIAQPFANHNGGMVAFGPDGYLYIGMGDGGSGGDPQGNGQDLGVLLGKLLRIDVDPAVAGDSYAIPPDNPFVVDGGPARLEEIWAYGLRNPWRFSFDRETGDLWIGDVGQNIWEEIDFQPWHSAGGENYGWNVYEATHTYPPDTQAPANTAPYIMPVVEYDHDAGQSVTGGYIYRGEGEPGLYGTYLYGDFEGGTIWGLQSTDTGFENRKLSGTDFSISSFGQDDDGELYVVDFRGAVYRIHAK